VKVKKIIDAADPIEADNEYHVENIMGSLENKAKVTYLVKWRGFPSKKDLIHENFKRLYLGGAKKELQKFHSKNPESRWDLALKTKN
jgi:hypothetical protein